MTSDSYLIQKIQTFVDDQTMYLDMEIEKEKEINKNLILKGRSLEVAYL
jgi:hypothetical protein